MQREDNLRNISVCTGETGFQEKDLAESILEEESRRYEQLEDDQAPTYKKPKLEYKAKAERSSKVRVWTQEEIKVYQELKDYKTTAERCLHLLGVTDEISIYAAVDVFKDLPNPSGKRAVAQAFSRLQLKMPKQVHKKQRGKRVFYSYKERWMKEVPIAEMYQLYQGKLDFKMIEDQYSPADPRLQRDVQEEVNLDYLIKEIKVLQTSAQMFDKAIQQLKDGEEFQKSQFSTIQKTVENLTIKLSGLGQLKDMLESRLTNDGKGYRLDVYFHFGG